MARPNTKPLHEKGERMNIPPREDGSEISGLPKVIYETLRAHPGWARDEEGPAYCLGKDCDWVKAQRGGTVKHWIKHQQYVLTIAVADWYYTPSYDSAGSGE